MSEEQREEKNKKRYEYRARKKVESITVCQSDKSNEKKERKIGNNMNTTCYRARKKAEANNVCGGDATPTNHTNDGITQAETVHSQYIHRDNIDSTYIEFDSGLFEPPIDFDHEGEFP
uniref:Uncharacterized protein n=1 Tax=Leersia perrieri TaxID=77586 RepID=A0A0D9XBS1_9ORYZ